ncbi:N-acylmannosamine kinase [Spirochaetia bacterium]|nr:N-acylmannosamine kinase [Spirochaetia bacterium]
MRLIGIDIGGTKCRVSLGSFGTTGTPVSGGLRIEQIGTTYTTAEYTPAELQELLLHDTEQLIAAAGEPPEAIGISCGGPLDQEKGVILSPPNLPGWDEIHITDFFKERTGIPAYLCNDANAGALAEWKYGAGKGYNNVIFITFGTGFGAGLILDGHLYNGASGQAGEIGHIRLAEFGPAGYGKAGSLEGFCSGGGIVRLARTMIEEELQQGRQPAICLSYRELDSLTAKKIGIAAEHGDPLAVKIYEAVGKKLGEGLSIVIDILNPEVIVLGSIFPKSRNEIWPAAAAVIERETLPLARKVCTVVPSVLGDDIGNYAALAVAQYGLEQNR